MVAKNSVNFCYLLCICAVTVITKTTTEKNSTDTSELSEEYSAENNSSSSNITDALTLKFATVCDTPNHDPGYCVSIKKCSTLLKQLNNSKAVNFLRESRCGPKNENSHNPKVCCGKYGNYKKPAASVEVTNPLPKECGYQKLTQRSRILGGTEAILGEFPWMALLVHRNHYGHKTYGCGAFLIHSKFVLTAAHCLQSENYQIRGPLIAVILGEHNLETKPDCSKGGTICAEHFQEVRVADFVVHPKYDQENLNHYNDIALIQLKKGAKMTTYVQPICLSTGNIIPVKYFISGWGSTENNTASPVKMKVALPPYDKELCKEKYNLVNLKITKSQICAGGEKKKDSCSGDSGGPLMGTTNGSSWFAAGIVSYGLGCGLEDWPGVYTNIPSYLTWIKGEITSRISVQTKSRRKVKTKKHNGKIKN